ncbi:MAG TPA: PEP-CTERM sorting domain-containing protein [Phycisphaerae bacterium]|nr:PEP-CTERM sorting domain-containing protein [Phycisphaerae bacterium]
MLNRLLKTTTLSLIVFCCANVANAGTAPIIQDIGLLNDNENTIPGSWPNAVSPNGEIVVGASTTIFPNSSEAFIWNGGNLTGLGDFPGSSGSLNGDPSSVAFDTSLGGTFTVGSANASSGTLAVIWHSNGSMEPLGDLSPGLTFDSEARGVTHDGSIVVGRADSPNGNEAFIWNGTMTGIGDLPGGDFNSIANGISADGSVIVGTGHSAAGQEAFIYTNNTMTGLGDLGGGDFRSAATAVSADGSTVVGWGNSQSGTFTEAFIWKNGLMIGLGDLPGGNPDSEALAVSGDGSVVIGKGRSNQYCGNCEAAFVWDSINGMRSLEDMLTDDHGVDLSGWRLVSATAISDDGLTIAGLGINESLGTFRRGFVVTLPEPGTCLMVSIGVLALAKRRR